MLYIEKEGLPNDINSKIIELSKVRNGKALAKTTLQQSATPSTMIFLRMKRKRFYFMNSMESVLIV